MPPTVQPISKLYFWRRLLAVWVDCLLAYILVFLGVQLGNRWGIYVPFELTVILLLLFTWIVGLTYWGSTPGKALTGLMVAYSGFPSARLPRIMIRESVGRLVSIFALVAPFALANWIAQTFPPSRYSFLKPLLILFTVGATLALVILQRRVPLHDRLARTRVSLSPRKTVFTRFGIPLAVASFLILVGGYVRECYSAYRTTQQMASDADFSLPCLERDRKALRDIRDLTADDEVSLARWLDEHGQSPGDFVIKKSREYPVVVLGEQHGQRENLTFLNEIIPVLYEKAGVTCIAMELYMAEENDFIQELITAKTFDDEAALELARRMDVWGVWGWKEYWDVLETAWNVNRSAPLNKPKLRVVGIGLPVDVQSMAMAGFEDNPGSNVSFRERLRVLRLPVILPAAFSRDAFMARELEKEILEKNERGVVLVGSAHTTINCPRPGSVESQGRMAFLLERKHPGQVFQIVLHQTQSTGGNDDEDPVFHTALDRIMALRLNQPVGFEVQNSPFSLLRDRASLKFRDDRLAFSDWAQGYVYFCRLEDSTSCDWIPGYITQSMYAKNKPFYNAYGKYFDVPVSSAEDIDRLLSDQPDSN